MIAKRIKFLFYVNNDGKKKDDNMIWLGAN